MKKSEIFDPWPDKYDAWFKTPIGRLVREYESRLILKMLAPSSKERILDAGCGSGVFSADLLSAGADVFGLDLSYPMLKQSGQKHAGLPLYLSQGSMTDLPFADDAFHKSVSITAIEFIEDAKRAIKELFRITRPGGVIVVATLNSSGPWAERRKRSGKEGHAIFQNVHFRSPEEMTALSDIEAVVESAVHFRKEDTPENAEEAEREGERKGLKTGAFVAVRWKKPYGALR